VKEKEYSINLIDLIRILIKAKNKIFLAGLTGFLLSLSYVSLVNMKSFESKTILRPVKPSEISIYQEIFRATQNEESDKFIKQDMRVYFFNVFKEELMQTEYLGEALRAANAVGDDKDSNLRLYDIINIFKLTKEKNSTNENPLFSLNFKHKDPNVIINVLNSLKNIALKNSREAINQIFINYYENELKKVQATIKSHNDLLVLMKNRFDGSDESSKFLSSTMELRYKINSSKQRLRSLDLFKEIYSKSDLALNKDFRPALFEVERSLIKKNDPSYLIVFSVTFILIFLSSSYHLFRQTLIREIFEENF